MHPVFRLLSYGGVNALCLPLNLALAWVLTELGMHYLQATIAGYALHVVLAFALNRIWTFGQNRVHIGSGLIRALIVHTTSFFLVLGVTALCVEYFELSFIVARIIAVGAAALFDYVADSFFTFKTNPFKT